MVMRVGAVGVAGCVLSGHCSESVSFGVGKSWSVCCRDSVSEWELVVGQLCSKVFESVAGQ
eukprot:645035-Rhodomonas_salina.1